MSFFSKWFDPNKAKIKKYQKIVDEINKKEKDISALTNKEIIGKIKEYEKLIHDGKNVDSLIADVFPLVRETSKRILGMRPFDVQIMGAIALNEGNVAEMKTGEGKTLVATLPVSLNALERKGVHMVTVNDYLSKRDAMWMAPIYKFLGMTVGVINTMNTSYEVIWENEEEFENAVENNFSIWEKDISEESNPFTVTVKKIERKDAYDLDILYGTNNEFGFDYLRDNLVYDLNTKTQKLHRYAIVDEVDSILIDEARTPLIISGPTKGTAVVYTKFARIAPKFKKDIDFEMEEKSKTISLTEEGIKKGEKLLGIDNLYDPSNIDDLYHINNSLIALHFYKKDVDYIVTDGNEVVIVDSFTGRLMPGRRFSGGLHQALEAKENVKIQEESINYATITFQNYFRMYDKLAGMTGTAKTEEEEFKQIYNMEVVVIPTNKQITREDKDDEIYRSEIEKYQAIVKVIIEKNKKGQPVLVGTTSIEKSELISKALKKLGVEHNVLNAKYHEKEAEIIAHAGEVGSVTIATNMAGRGTDIKLGEGVKELGGLCVIGSERHEARRIDNQLRGRSGRQGDAGESIFYLSVGDDLVRIFGGEKIAKIMDMMKMEEGEPIYHPMLTRLIEQSQKKVEGMHFSMRKYLLELDTVMDSQRKSIYEHRDWVLGESDISDHLKDIYQDVIDTKVDIHCQGTEWDLEALKNSLKIYPVDFSYINIGKYDNISSIKEDIFEKLFEGYLQKKEEIGEDFNGLQKYLLLRIIDDRWRKHLESIDSLKEGISLRAYGQKDPVMEFKKESHRLFEEMIDSIYEDMSTLLLRVAKVNSDDASKEAQKEVDALKYTHDDVDTFSRKQRRKIENKNNKAKKRFKVKR